MLGMLAVGALAVSVPRALTQDEAASFAIAYVVVRLVPLVLYAHVGLSAAGSRDRVGLRHGYCAGGAAGALRPARAYAGAIRTLGRGRRARTCPSWSGSRRSLLGRGWRSA